MAAALSMGDLGVIALFAGEHQATLPLVVSQLPGPTGWRPPPRRR
jgi:thiamine transport system permease protein